MGVGETQNSGEERGTTRPGRGDNRTGTEQAGLDHSLRKPTPARPPKQPLREPRRHAGDTPLAPTSLVWAAASRREGLWGSYP